MFPKPLRFHFAQKEAVPTLDISRESLSLQSDSFHIYVLARVLDLLVPENPT